MKIPLLCIGVLLLQCSAQAAELSIHFSAPAPAARVWVDDEHPVSIEFEVIGGALPKGSYVVLYINGRDVGQKFVQLQNKILLPELDEGTYTMRAVLFDRRGAPTETTTTQSFMARRYLELMVHDDFPVSAEGPRSDGSVSDMPGLDEWEYGSEEEDSMAMKAIRERWAEKLRHDPKHHANNSLPDGSKILEAYREFHQRIMSDPKLWHSNQFLVYRTMDRGLGNQLESLVSAFVMALLSNRVFLVDSTIIHHLFRPPAGLAWHYSPIPDTLNHDHIADRAFLLDLRWQNPLEFPNLLCNNLGAAYKKQFLFVFSDQYFLPALLHNKAYKATLRDWFGLSDLFGAVARHILRPKDFIADQALAIYNRHLRGAAFTIGIQVVRLAARAAGPRPSIV